MNYPVTAIRKRPEVVQGGCYEETQEKTPETEVDEPDDDNVDNTSPYDPTEEF